MPSHVNRWAATVPGSMTPTGESIASVSTAISWVVRFSASSTTPSASATMSIDWPKPTARKSSIGLAAASSRRLAEQHDVADDVDGGVGTEVGELLRPHVRIARESAESSSGNRSVMPPGLMPVPCRLTPPDRQAASTVPTSWLFG